MTIHISRLLGLTGSLALAAVIVSCSPASTSPGTTPAPSMTGPTGSVASSRPSSTASSSISSVPSDYSLAPGPGAQAPPEPSPQPTAGWSGTDEQDAISAATKALSLFARPDLSAGVWFTELKPWLSADAAESYSYTDPSSVPVRKVTAPGTLVKDPTNPFGGFVEFGTDAGRYRVQVVRVGSGSPWQVAAIAPVSK